MKKVFALVGCTCASLMSTTVMAQTAITFTGGSPTSAFSGSTSGYQFTVNETIQIGELGYWDQGSDGLVSSHDVGIWNSTGSILLASTVVPSGTGSALIDGFRFVNIAILTLGPGSYLAGGLQTTTDAEIRFANASTIPQIVLGSTRYSAGGTGFAAPILAQGTTFDDGYFGPNFRLANVPEPATWSLMLTGFGLIGYGLRRRKVSVSFV